MLPTVPMMLLFFGLAHLCYIWLFWRVLAVRRVPPWAVVYALWFGILLAVLWPTLGALLIAVAVYGLVLGGTAVAASRCHPLIASGGAFFLASDTILAFEIFMPDATPAWASPLIMFTYCLGQGLIAAGVIVADRLRTRDRDPRNGGSDAVTEGSVRVDAWLWAVRVYKTRSAATTACRAGHVRVNGDRAKAAQPVRPGDELRVRIAGFDRILVVRQPISKRVGAVLAAAAVDDHHSSPAAARAHGVRADARPRRGSPHQARASRHRQAPRPRGLTDPRAQPTHPRCRTPQPLRRHPRDAGYPP